MSILPTRWTGRRRRSWLGCSSERCWPADGEPPSGKRSRPRVYGEHAISLAKRAGQKRAWSHGVFKLYDGTEAKRYKTFLATWRPAGGVIRVVLVDEPHGWRAYFSTDPEATVADVLTTINDRFSMETACRIDR